MAAIHAQQQQNMLLQAQLNAQQQQQQQIAALASASQPSSVINSPPSQIKSDDLSVLSSDPLQMTQQFIQENKALRSAQLINSSAQSINQNNNSNFNGPQNPLHGSTSAPDFSDKWSTTTETEDSPSFQYNSKDANAIPGNVRGLQRQVLAVQMGRLSANSSFNKGSNPDKPLVHAHSFDSNTFSKEDLSNLVSFMPLLSEPIKLKIEALAFPPKQES